MLRDPYLGHLWILALARVSERRLKVLLDEPTQSRYGPRVRA